MKVFIPVILLISVLASTPNPLEAQSKRSKIPVSANFTIESLAPGVWAAINNDYYGKAICNAGIVDIGTQTLIFDPFMNPSAAVELREIAKKLTGRKTFVVINSHHHNDHIRGNQAFLPNATIISTEATKTAIEMNEPDEQEWEKKHAPTLLQALRKRMINASSVDRDELPYWIGYYEGLVESSDHLFMALADETFEDSMWIEGNKLKVKLIERRNGHTVSDVVMLIPSLGIAFMGDLLTNERHPWISDGSIDGWKHSLKMFYEDTAYHTYVPGHGKVCGKPALKALYQYLTDVEELCNAATTEAAQNELMNKPIPEAYKSWWCARFYQPNLQYLIHLARTGLHRNK